ncbi:hypothetical protein [Subtercola frigoramans]|uniref:Uncharacterized protein n=1 Tax=Subtercola frigoramans TaxID=120298 RepID=A0ABS2L3Q7_9MICO|nr:hypothetical protein [Subtercola frigoramans]MBM7471707.1 hypothetical protein [Subtercola frigoramans]
MLESLSARGQDPTFNPNIIFDYTICFAAAGNCGFDGRFHLGRQPAAGIGWLIVASTGLRLNTPAEVRDLLAGRPVPPVVPLYLAMPQ